MNKLITTSIIGLLTTLPSLLNAQPSINMELATKYACTACHQVEAKVVGPAYKDVYEKYKNDAGAEDRLVEKVKKGGAGVWGEIPMSPNPTVPEEDLRKLVKGILGK